MPMRLVLVSQDTRLRTRGGIATQTLQGKHGLARLGHQVFVISHARTSSVGSTTTTLKVNPGDGYDRSAPVHTLEAWWLAHA